MIFDLDQFFCDLPHLWSQQMYLKTNWCVRLVHICHAGERKQIGRRLPLITLVGMRSCGLREGENNKPLSANKGHTQLSHATEQSAPSCSLPLVPAMNRHSPLIKVSKFASEKQHCPVIFSEHLFTQTEDYFNHIGRRVSSEP